MATAAQLKAAEEAGLFDELDAIDAARTTGNAVDLDAIDAELDAIDAARDEEGEAMRAAAEPQYPAEQEFVGVPGMAGEQAPQENWAQRVFRQAAEPAIREQMARRPAQEQFAGAMEQKHSQRSLLPGVTPEGVQVPSPDAGGLHAREASYYEMPGTEFEAGYGDAVTSRQLPEPEPLPEGIGAAFSDADEPKEKDERTAMEKGQDAFFSDLADVALEAGGEVAKWAARVTVGNVGRAWGALSLPFKEIGDFWSVTNAVEEARYYNKIVDDMAVTLENPDMLRRLSQEQVAYMRKAVIDQRARKDEIHNHRSKIIDTMMDMENVIKERVSSGILEMVYMSPVNAIRDSRDIAMGMGHLVFMDILGLKGESAQAAEVWNKWEKSHWMANAVDYSSVVMGDGADSGEDITGGAIGAAMALSATVVPRGMHVAADEFVAGNEILPVTPDQSWRGRFGLGFDALETAPFTTTMFLIGPMARSVARAKGKIAKGTAYYKAASDQFALQYGKAAPEYVDWANSRAAKAGAPVPKGVARAAMDLGRKTPEYRRWRRGDGDVPPELAAANEALNRRKSGLIGAVLDTLAAEARWGLEKQAIKRTPEYKRRKGTSADYPASWVESQQARRQGSAALVDKIMDAGDLAVEYAHEGAWRAKRAAKSKFDQFAERPRAGAVVRAARSVRTNNQRVNMVLQQWWSDALQQLDENSAVMANATVRGTAEIQAGALGLARAFSEASLRGELWADAAASKPPIPGAGAPRPAIPQPPPLPPRLQDRSARPVAPVTQADMSQTARQSVEGRRRLRAEGDEAFLGEMDAIAANIDQAEFAQRGQKEAVLNQQVKTRFREKFGEKGDGEYVAWLDGRGERPGFSLMDTLLKEEASGEAGLFGRADGVWSGFEKRFGKDVADLLTPIYEARGLHKFLPERVVDAALGRKTGEKARMGAKSGETFEMTPYAPDADTRGIRPREPGALPEAPAGFASGSKTVDAVKYPEGSVLDRAVGLVREHKRARLSDFQEKLGLSYREAVKVLQGLQEDGAIAPTGKIRRNPHAKRKDIEEAPFLHYSNHQTWDVATRKQPPRQPRTRGDLPPMPETPSSFAAPLELKNWRESTLKTVNEAWEAKSKSVENAWKKQNPSGGKLALKRHMEQERKKFVDDMTGDATLPREVEGGLLYDPIVAADDAWRAAEPGIMEDLPAKIGREPTWQDVQDARLDFIEKRLSREDLKFEVVLDEEGGLLGPLSEESIAARRKAIEEAAPKKAPVYAEPPLAPGMTRPKAPAGEVALPRPVDTPAPVKASAPIKAKPAEQYVPNPQKRRRNHVHGVFETEWPRFKEFVENEHGMPWKEAVKKMGAGDDVRGGRLLALQWFKRTGQSRVQAAINAQLHQFSPAEVLYFNSQLLDYAMQLGPEGFKKAEYSAYRDVLLNRGLNVTSDYKNLGLGVEQLPAWADDAAWRAAVEESGGKAALDAGILKTSLPSSAADPRWTTPAKVSKADEAQLFAHVDRKLNENYPVSRGLAPDDAGVLDEGTGAFTDDGVRMPFERRGAGVLELEQTMRTVEQNTGFEFTKQPTHEAFSGAEQRGIVRPGVQQELPMFTPKHKFTPELTQRINKLASSIGVGPQYLTESFAQVLNWRSYPYFMKSQVAQNRVKARFNSEVNAFNKAAKLEGRTGDVISRAERGRLMNQLDGTMKSMSVGYGSRGVISPIGSKFRFDVMDTARKTMTNDAQFMRSVLADASLSAGFKMADELRTAKVRDIARKEYAKAPTTNWEIWNSVNEFFDGGRGTPALLRRNPAKVMESLNTRIEKGNHNWSKMDIDQMVRSLERYEPLDKPTLEYLGLDPKEGPVYAPKAFERAIRIEIQTQDMIKTNNLMDRFVRSTKRNLVPANLATIVRNTMSDWNLLALQEGRPGVIFDVIKSGKELHRFQTGKMKRADNPVMYEVFEAMERTGLVDATFLEANFGHAKFKGTMSVIGDMIQGQGDGYSAWRWNQLERAIEKKGYEPFLKAFRASTNSFKQYKAMHAFGNILDAVHKHRVGETFQLEVRPNRWSTFEVQTGGVYKHVDSGRTLSRQQWMDAVARTSKVTSDKLFFDYSDAGAWLKLLRAKPGVRWLMGSLFSMYYAKSATIPGVQKGLMFNVRNPNPAMRPGNDAVRYSFADKAAQTDARVSAMSAGARSSMLGSADRDALLDATGWRRNRAPMAAYYAHNDGSSLDMYNFDFLDFHESTDTISRAMSAGILTSAEALGLIPDDTGDLAVIYAMDKEGRKLNQSERLNYKLEGLSPEEKRYAQGLRKIKMRELKGEGFRGWTDLAEMVFLRGGPLLELITKVERSEMSDRTIDMEEALQQFGTTMMHGTFGKAANVAVAKADPTSKYSTFKYRLNDPETVIRDGGGALAERILRWGISQLIMRMPKRTDLDPASKQNVKRQAGARSALNESLVVPLKDLAKRSRNAAMIADNPEQKKKLLDAANNAEVRAGRREGVIEQEVGRIEQAQGELLESVNKEKAREEKANENAPAID
ncbi:MAG: hypothetical protein CMI60_04065 [Parvibaculum sp.]|nr:hypothetical protein [Parvibaculum sp.]